MDSCCIDKASSSELSEAINSMFQWYRNAEACYAYLSDVHSTENVQIRNELHLSQWFTRGWTPQELLAPPSVVFFNSNWLDIGSKASLSPLISRITGVENIFDFESASVAQKMSWVAERITTRIEDRAYCLMGLFGINMPLLYGEGNDSFLRLQLEILKISDDESIFAWQHPVEKVSEPMGLLAPAPRYFRRSGNIVRHPFDAERPPYSMTNKGLRMEIIIESIQNPHSPGARKKSFCGPLNCRRRENDTPLGIFLTSNGGQIQRCFYSELPDYQPRARKHGSQSRGVVYIAQSNMAWFNNLNVGHAINASLAPLHEHGFSTSTQTISGKVISPIPLQPVFPAHGWLQERNDIDVILRDDQIWGLLCVGPGKSFLVTVNNFNGDLGTEIILLPKTIDRWLSQLNIQASHKRRPDRVSECLPSGNSVSVVLKKCQVSKSLVTILNISIQKEGGLQWPTLNAEGFPGRD